MFPVREGRKIMRPDGTLVKHEDPMYYLIPHFLTKRYDAMNMITLDIPKMPMRAYMNEKLPRLKYWRRQTP